MEAITASPARRAAWPIAAVAALFLAAGNVGAQETGPAAPDTATEGPQEPASEALSAQLRRLGELIRQMGDAAARTAQDLARCDPARAGTASIAPEVAASERAALYGPEGPTERSVRALLEHRLVVLGNARLRAGRVAASAKGVVADVVTAKEGALVERFVVDRETGRWVPER